MATGFDTSWAAIAFLAPSVLFICLISAFRGFFQGQGNMIPTSVSQVLEAIAKLAVGLLAAVLLHEQFTAKSIVGCAMIAFGTLLMVL